MGLEHFYRFFDREVIDPALEMPWKAFLRQCSWDRECLDNVLSVAVEPEPDEAMISHILENHTLRWTLLRSSPAYWLLYEIIHHSPSLHRRCPVLWLHNHDEIRILDAVAVDAFLEGRIPGRTLWAVHNIDGREDPRGSLELTRSEFKRVEKALNGGAVERPILPWLSDDCLGDGYHCLGIGDTRRFIGFLCKAWHENWPVLRLGKDVMEKVEADKMFEPSFRDFSLGAKLIACAKTVPLSRPCVLRYFG